MIQKIRTALLKRTDSSDQGTFGFLLTDNGFSCATAELPWRENKPNESCIPAGKYYCVFRTSSKFGSCYELLRVPARTDILIHVGNFVGDKKRRFRSDSLGCILIGKKVQVIQGQKAVTESRKTLDEFQSDMGRLNFELEIVDAFS